MTQAITRYHFFVFEPLGQLLSNFHVGFYYVTHLYAIFTFKRFNNLIPRHLSAKSMSLLVLRKELAANLKISF